MSYNPNNFHSPIPQRPGTGVHNAGSNVPSAIAEVAAEAPNSLRHSYATRFKNFPSFCSWTVEGLASLPVGTTSVESVPFFHQNGSEWCMVLTKQSDGLYLSFLLKKCETEKPLRVLLKAIEITPTGEKREVFSSVWCNLSRGVKSEQKRIRETSALHNQDKISLQCQVWIQCIIHDELPVAEAAEPHISVMKGLGEMFVNEVLTDFDLHAGGTVLKAHRALLSIRSPYFAAMLQPHTKEAIEGRVDILDVKPEVLKQVLLYMYTGVAPALKDMPWDIVIAADKYQMDNLKGLCEVHIAGCLNVDNAAETAANAKDFSCDILWDCAVLYIKQNISKVLPTPGWSCIVDTHPKVVKEICSLVE